MASAPAALDSRMWFSRVVLPEPKKPVNTVTGTTFSMAKDEKMWKDPKKTDPKTAQNTTRHALPQTECRTAPSQQQDQT